MITFFVWLKILGNTREDLPRYIPHCLLIRPLTVSIFDHFVFNKNCWIYTSVCTWKSAPCDARKDKKKVTNDRYNLMTWFSTESTTAVQFGRGHLYGLWVFFHAASPRVISVATVCLPATRHASHSAGVKK